MSDRTTYHRGARNFGTGYDVMARIVELEAALKKADALEKSIMEDFRKESMETIRDLSLARRAYRAAREAVK